MSGPNTQYLSAGLNAGTAIPIAVGSSGTAVTTISGNPAVDLTASAMTVVKNIRTAVQLLDNAVTGSAISVQTEFSYAHRSASGSATIKNSAGLLHRIIVTETAAGPIQIFDGTGSSSGVMLMELKASIAEGSYEVNARFLEALAVSAGAQSKYTVVYK